MNDYPTLIQIGERANALALGSPLSRDERTMLPRETDGDRLAWLDARRACIQIGEHISHGATIEFEDGAWALRVTNGADLTKLELPTLRDAIDALTKVELPTGDGMKCEHCDAELNEAEIRDAQWHEPRCDECNRGMPTEELPADPRAGAAEVLNARPAR